MPAPTSETLPPETLPPETLPPELIAAMTLAESRHLCGETLSSGDWASLVTLGADVRTLADLAVIVLSRAENAPWEELLGDVAPLPPVLRDALRLIFSRRQVWSEPLIMAVLLNDASLDRGAPCRTPHSVAWALTAAARALSLPAEPGALPAEKAAFRLLKELKLMCSGNYSRPGSTERPWDDSVWKAAEVRALTDGAVEFMQAVQLHMSAETFTSLAKNLINAAGHHRSPLRGRRLVDLMDRLDLLREDWVLSQLNREPTRAALRRRAPRLKPLSMTPRQAGAWATQTGDSLFWAFWEWPAQPTFETLVHLNHQAFLHSWAFTPPDPDVAHYLRVGVPDDHDRLLAAIRQPSVWLAGKLTNLDWSDLNSTSLEQLHGDLSLAGETTLLPLLGAMGRLMANQTPLELALKNLSGQSPLLTLYRASQKNR